MEDLYRDPSLPGSFGGVNAIFRATQGQISKGEIKKHLQSVDAYTLHKPARRRFPTNRVIVHTISQQFQSDLVDVGSLSKYNDGYRYILTCIDVFSKFAFAIPLKTKRADEIINAFKKIFSIRKPRVLQTDRGSEFLNRKFQRFLKEEKVRFFTTYSSLKASICERYNRSLKTRMWRYFTAKNTYRYLDVLQGLVDSYNSSYHTSLQRAPIDVTPDNESEVWRVLYGHSELISKEPCSFDVGDAVRVSKHKMTFEKGYQENWSEEIFKITDCVRRVPRVYRIQDLLGEPIQGTFYKQELQRVELKENYTVEKILKKRSKRGKIEYFVKYKGYPSKFNQWIPSTNLFSI